MSEATALPPAPQPQPKHVNFLSVGLEHQLGDEAHDDPVRGREERHLQLPLGRLQGEQPL